MCSIINIINIIIIVIMAQMQALANSLLVKDFCCSLEWHAHCTLAAMVNSLPYLTF